MVGCEIMPLCELCDLVVAGSSPSCANGEPMLPSDPSSKISASGLSSNRWIG